jgi:hypothetical protein
MEDAAIARALRDAIKASGKSHYWIGARASVSDAVIGRFMRGERMLHVTTMERVMIALRLTCEIKPVPKTT